MENLSISLSNDTLANSTELLVDELLPIGAVALAPVLFLELVAAVVSNSLLLALVILACVYKLNNNINIYLFSLGINGLLGAFNTLCLLTMLIARRWVLGTFICALNWLTLNVSYMLYLVLYIIISRDKYKIVKDSLSQLNKKRAYLNSAIIWALSVVFGLLTVFDDIFRDISGSKSIDDNFACFGLSIDNSGSRIRNAIAVSAIVAGSWLIAAALTGTSFIYFMRILFELRRLKKFRLHFMEEYQRNCTISIYEQDRPLYATGEERTAKSLAIIYLAHFLAISISFVIRCVFVIPNRIMHDESQDNQIYFILLLIAHLFPSTNPLYLIISNKRLRKRAKGLFKCELKPYLGDSPAHIAARKVAMKQGKKLKLSRNKVFPQPV